MPPSDPEEHTTQSTRASARRTTERSADAAGMQVGAVATSAQRVLYTTVGALATAGDAIRQSALTYSRPRRLARQLGQFERRGQRALESGRRKVDRRAR